MPPPRRRPPALSPDRTGPNPRRRTLRIRLILRVDALILKEMLDAGQTTRPSSFEQPVFSFATSDRILRLVARPWDARLSSPSLPKLEERMGEARADLIRKA